MDDKTLKKICKIVLKKDKKKKPKANKRRRQLPMPNPNAGAFPIAGKAGFGTYGQPFGYVPPAGGTTIVARDQPLEVIKKPSVDFVGNLSSTSSEMVSKKTDDQIKAEGVMEFLKALQSQQNITQEKPSNFEDIFIKQPKVKQPEMTTENLFTEDDEDAEDLSVEFMGETIDLTRQERINKLFRPKAGFEIIEPRGGGGINPFKDDDFSVSTEQSTEILQPQLDFSLIAERARERKERSQMAEDDINKANRFRKLEDIPPRLREVAERSRMGREDVDVFIRPRTFGYDASEFEDSVTGIDNPLFM